MIRRFLVLCVPFVLTSCAGAGPEQSTIPLALAATAPAEVQAEPLPLGPDAAEADLSVARREIPAEGPRRGSSEPLVTIVAFTGFQCPFSARVQPTLIRLLERYPDVALVVRMRPLPFHVHGEPAAEAALEAYAQGGDAAFFRMHDLLYQNQRDLRREDLVAYASEVGLDVGRFEVALDDHRHRAAVERDSALAVEVGASGTPTFFINGRIVRGAQPYEAFDEIVRAELEEAQSFVARGLPRADVYAAFMHAARARAALPEYAEVEAPAPSEEPAMVPDPSAVYRVPVDDDPALGPADALVTVVAFGDFECPFTDRARATLDALRDRYGDRIRVVWKNNPLPFHPHAMLAAIAAEEAYAQGGNRAFWALHARIFTHLRDLDRAVLEREAAELGLDMAKLGLALDGELHRADIERESELARSVGASGTPSFFVNGRLLKGAQPVEVFVGLIDEELEKAEARVRSGVRRVSLYEAIIADGHTTPQLIERPSAPGPDHVYELPITPGRPALGPATAPVVMQAVLDFQCPFSARVQPTLAALRERYGDRLRLVVRHYPLPHHADAALAAEAAMEVYRQRGDEAFFRYAERLFANQGALERPDLERYAAELGRIQMARFRRALDRRTHRTLVEDDAAAIVALGARIGTPSFFINGRLVQGVQPIEAFVGLIDRALREAEVDAPADGPGGATD
jgi:protein-disulfide isomerase